VLPFSATESIKSEQKSINAPELSDIVTSGKTKAQLKLWGYGLFFLFFPLLANIQMQFMSSRLAFMHL